MTEPAQSSTLPADDASRHLTVSNANTDQSLPHLAIVGDTYTVVISSQDTAGKYSLMDILIPSAENGPPLHRHDYEEMFYLIEGQITLTVRSETVTLKAGDAVNIPANAPHHFSNTSGAPARFLCMTIGTGLENFFNDIGTRVATRDTPAPAMTEAEVRVFMDKAIESAPRNHMELLPPQ